MNTKDQDIIVNFLVNSFQPEELQKALDKLLWQLFEVDVETGVGRAEFARLSRNIQNIHKALKTIGNL